jgi:hypothetical protein
LYRRVALRWNYLRMARPRAHLLLVGAGTQ